MRTAIVGVGATAVMDAGGALVRALTGVAPLDYALLGRWIGHMRHGRFAHRSIADADPVPYEQEMGTVAHYAIGMSFAAVLEFAVSGWLDRPRLAPALTIGVASSVAPFLIMQPAFGMGIAASRTPAPWTVRARSVRSHAIYGVGLYVTAKALASTPPRRGRRHRSQST